MPTQLSNHPPVRLSLSRLKTPIGTALLVTDERGLLRALDWSDHEDRLTRLLRLYYGAGIALETAKAPADLRITLDGYFAGDLKQIDAIACAAAGTDFQRSVWAALRKIPAGKTMSYGALAAKLGKPAAMRAVGAANGANPLSVVVPCHRLIGANGSLIKYGGGLERKRWLLTHEGVA
ncbi:methylated-DNA--[protein]-cysteine S-methyltransferase [Ferrovibrio sp.]|uniref:methylated-DNA--[protein]-cysteine S-methyltransferase n=1 Tax=Ferrovibrio sp. TaxID=1917215 RepID=UPI000CA6649B|nr:methylated-DNA--[protein]-cysteine S-methyltransferase [Ferrovibrio sp.]PJI42333.1 MAG: methylated-DNA--protein-cysteine methyltransferase [Ferrovibrio sp.]